MKKNKILKITIAFLLIFSILFGALRCDYERADAAFVVDDVAFAAFCAICCVCITGAGCQVLKSADLSDTATTLKNDIDSLYSTLTVAGGVVSDEMQKEYSWLCNSAGHIKDKWADDVCSLELALNSIKYKDGYYDEAGSFVHVTDQGHSHSGAGHSFSVDGDANIGSSTYEFINKMVVSYIDSAKVNLDSWGSHGVTTSAEFLNVISSSTVATSYYKNYYYSFTGALPSGYSSTDCYILNSCVDDSGPFKDFVTATMLHNINLLYFSVDGVNFTYFFATDAEIKDFFTDYKQDKSISPTDYFSTTHLDTFVYSSDDVYTIAGGNKKISSDGYSNTYHNFLSFTSVYGYDCNYGFSTTTTSQTMVVNPGASGDVFLFNQGTLEKLGGDVASWLDNVTDVEVDVTAGEDVLVPENVIQDVAANPTDFNSDVITTDIAGANDGITVSDSSADSSTNILTSVKSLPSKIFSKFKSILDSIYACLVAIVTGITSIPSDLADVFADVLTIPNQLGGLASDVISLPGQIAGELSDVISFPSLDDLAADVVALPGLIADELADVISFPSLEDLAADVVALPGLIADELAGDFTAVLEGINAIPVSISDVLEALFVPDIDLIDTNVTALKKNFGFVDDFKKLASGLINMDLEPHDYIKIYNWNKAGNKYDQRDSYIISFSWYAPYKKYIDEIIVAFVYMFFIWRIFIKLPSIVNGAGGDIVSADAAETRYEKSKEKSKK